MQVAAQARNTRQHERGIATLDPERLNRKRATDRRSQQALRERTRQKMSNLESRIEELTQNLNDLKEQLETVTSERDHLADERTGLRAQLDALSELQSRLQAATEERNRLLNSRSSLQSQSNEIQADARWGVVESRDVLQQPFPNNERGQPEHDPSEHPGPCTIPVVISPAGAPNLEDGYSSASDFAMPDFATFSKANLVGPIAPPDEILAENHSGPLQVPYHAQNSEAQFTGNAESLGQLSGDGAHQSQNLRTVVDNLSPDSRVRRRSTGKE